MNTEIYLDMDGVCVDFIGAAMTTQGYDARVLLAKWRREHPGSLYPEVLFRKPAPDFFTHENLQSSEFWARLAPYDWFDQLYAELGRLGHVVFLTAPTGAPGCVAGKQEWLAEKFGRGFMDFIFTRHKDRLAHANACLIDDMPLNTGPFDDRGGKGVLFPQIWNELARVEDPVAHVLESLEQHFGARASVSLPPRR